MGLKLNLVLSIGALLPFFTLLLVISALIIRQILFFVISLFLFSLLINAYSARVVSNKKKFNPKPIKIESLDSLSMSAIGLSLLSIIIAVAASVLSITKISEDYVLVFVLCLSVILIIFYTFYLRENSVSLILGIRILFPIFYVVTTDNNSKIYLISKEKIQANRNIKAYHVINDVYFFGYISSN